jgi:hypothetical protein
MSNSYGSSTNGLLGRIAILFLLAWMLALPGGAQADSPKNSGRKAKSDAAAKSVKGMRLKVSGNGRYFVGRDGKPTNWAW